MLLRGVTVQGEVGVIFKIGEHLLVCTAAGWSHLNLADGRPRAKPAEDKMRKLLSDALSANPQRYGNVTRVSGDRGEDGDGRLGRGRLGQAELSAEGPRHRQDRPALQGALLAVDGRDCSRQAVGDRGD